MAERQFGCVERPGQVTMQAFIHLSALSWKGGDGGRDGDEPGGGGFEPAHIPAAGALKAARWEFPQQVQNHKMAGPAEPEPPKRARGRGASRWSIAGRNCMISWLLSVTACCFGFKLNGVEGVKRCPPKLPTALRTMKWTIVATLVCIAECNRLKTSRPAPWSESSAAVVKGIWKDSSMGNSSTASCNPECLWKCLGTACQEVCEPVCAPPKCQTTCRPVNAEKCVQTCEAPRCAVICPEKPCANGENCGKCKTVCGEPVCHVDCKQDCQTNCANPTCEWKCKPTAECPQPKCELRCGLPPDCQSHSGAWGTDGVLKVPPGHSVITLGNATLDAQAFQALAAPAPAPATAPVLSPAAA
eukprot:symbB.v1.2.010783.t1/scaffold707.1/size170859/4